MSRQWYALHCLLSKGLLVLKLLDRSLLTLHVFSAGTRETHAAQKVGGGKVEQLWSMSPTTVGDCTSAHMLDASLFSRLLVPYAAGRKVAACTR